MDASGQTKAIRVVVRVRPLLPSDGATDHSLLQLDQTRPNEVLLASGNDRRTARRYAFDHVVGPDVTQDELYGRVGVAGMVAAVVEGYHSTIFAYGQTGSGKTYTMEGYRYVSQSHGSAGNKPVAGSAGGHGGVARVGATAASASASAPQADFAATPDEQLGLTPRAVRELFAATTVERNRRFQIRCSFVQIYREQVYDLLNPATLARLPGSSSSRCTLPHRPGSGGGGAGGPLRMRWSQQEGFYLENLFMPEIESADEAISAFQAGVANKVMSSHRLNAASSRSHCIFTLHVSASLLQSPLEQRTAKLTLVDLAGSERASHTGATEGALRDESVAINKSLFTLRKVITALTESAAAAANANANAANASGATAAAPPHVPYRDSKLTCLLKHSLGGSSVTLMVACLSPADRFLEENASTLEYAARARRIMNQVSVNEDPRSRLIRELRAEVAFLRQQLEAAGTAASPLPLPLPSVLAAYAATSGATAAKIAGFTAPSPSPPLASATANNTAPCSSSGGGDGRDGAFSGEDEAAYANRLRSSDVEVLVRAVIEASRVAVASSAALASLRIAYARTSASLEALRAEYDTLATEDARVRDRLSLLEALVAADWGAASRPVGSTRGTTDVRVERGGSEVASSSANRAAAGLYTASTAALIELEELRRENALLHERLQLLEPEIGPSGVVSSMASRGSMGSMIRARPRTAAAGWGGNGSGGGGLGTSTGRGAGVPAVSIGRRQQQTQRAQSAGALLPLPSGIGRIKTGGSTAAVAAAAAAAAASNRFIPNDVLSTVLPPSPTPTPAPASGGSNGGSGRLGPGPKTQTGAGSSISSSSKTLTVEQLRSVLQMNGGGGGGGGGGGTDLSVEADTGSPARTTAAAAATTATGRLTELGHAVASRALASGVRLSTTGKLLPAAPARMAVEAAAGGLGECSSPLRTGTTSNTVLLATAPASSSKETALLSGRTAALSEAAVGPPTGSPQGPLAPELALVQLLANRNVLTRQRLTGGQ